jgi:hypothetical protein
MGSEAPGPEKNLLSPDLADDFQMVYSSFQPGSDIRQTVMRSKRELVYLVRGRPDVEIEGVIHHIAAGDGCRFRWRRHSLVQSLPCSDRRHLGHHGAGLLK